MSDIANDCHCGRPSCQPPEPLTPAQRRAAANEQIAEYLRHYVMTHFACTRISVSELERIIDRADGQP